MRPTQADRAIEARRNLAIDPDIGRIAGGVLQRRILQVCESVGGPDEHGISLSQGQRRRKGERVVGLLLVWVVRENCVVALAGEGDGKLSQLARGTGRTDIGILYHLGSVDRKRVLQRVI